MRNMTQRQLEIAILIAAPSAAVVGFLLMWVSAWLTATPVRSVRDALKQVEGATSTPTGGLRRNRTRRTSAGFNSMVEGLRERERCATCSAAMSDVTSPPPPSNTGRRWAARAPRRGAVRRHSRVHQDGDQPPTNRGRRAAQPLLRRHRRRGRPPPRHGEQSSRATQRSRCSARPSSFSVPRTTLLAATARSPAGSRQEVPECRRGSEWPPVGWWPKRRRRERFDYGDRGAGQRGGAAGELARSEPNRALASAATGGGLRTGATVLAPGQAGETARVRRAGADRHPDRRTLTGRVEVHQSDDDAGVGDEEESDHRSRVGRPPPRRRAC